jgi:hypothetical protein
MTFPGGERPFVPPGFPSLLSRLADKAPVEPSRRPHI